MGEREVTRQGAARHGEAGPGEAGMGEREVTRQGAARRGKAGLGVARHGEVRQAGAGWQGLLLPSSRLSPPPDLR